MVGRPLLRFNAQQIQMFRNHYNLVDSDADGRISKAEFGVLFRSLGQVISNKRLEAIIQEVYKDAPSEGINFEEFMDAFMSHFSTPPTEKAVREAMMLFDRSNTGYIDKKDLAQLLTDRGEKLDQTEINYLFELLDIRQDTRSIDYVNFVEEIYRMLPILSPQTSSNSD
ncbi:EF hand family protein [Babesia divergens]|uniref:EF hand family protein n=1 Tax=Babesia divergens TaxID=32595 RepID=A0AAD9LEG3_BABDI|nr:EF hand family protein [Babesia divergens]